ncbi:hypothetical protein CBS101457_003117 [Exobasidium rhododendri]|nr:hypothetical protein CBS101457_003117 [Exobasidium rhododendri]
MAIGILDVSTDYDGKAVPGTRLFEPLQQIDTTHLKRDPKNSEVVLQPQPSDLPEDPLNWSKFRKEVIYATLLWGAIVAGVSGPTLGPALASLSVSLRISITAAIGLTGYFVLAYGLASGVVVIGSTITGKRFWYVVGSTLALVGDIWAGAYSDYHTLLAARVFQGLGTATFGMLANATINDLWFLHEQGTRTAIWQLAFNGSVSLCPILSGLIYNSLGIRSLFWILTACQALVLILTLLFFPETSYQRSSTRATDVDSLPRTSSVHSTQAEKMEEKSSVGVKVDEYEQQASRGSTGMARSRGLGLFYAQDRQGTSVSLIMLRPLLVLFTPSIAFACICYMLSFTWFVTLSSLSSYIYAPYNFDASQVGYASGVSQVIGCLISLLSSGPILDWSARLLSKKNNGYYEPEMRLVLLVPAFFAMLIGSFGLAFSLQDARPWIVPTVFLGFITAGAGYGLTAAIAYATDSYPDHGGDTFGIIMMVKGLFAWGTTLFIGDWFVERGPVSIFVTLGSLSLFIFLVGIPVYVFGKRLRSWSTRSPMTWVL